MHKSLTIRLLVAICLANSSWSFAPKPPTVMRRKLPGLYAKSGTEIGIQTAQLLMDERRHDKLTKELSQKFSLVPAPLLGRCVDVVANAFSSVAPNQLKQALKPGGMVKIRPELSNAICGVVLTQPVVKTIPLSGKDKALLAEYLVDMALDYVLRDAKMLLEAPEVRLEALEEEMNELKQMMGPGRLLLYRVRRLPRAAKIGSIAAAIVAFVYIQQGAINVASFANVGKAAVKNIGLLTVWISRGARFLLLKATGVVSSIGKLVTS